MARDYRLQILVSGRDTGAKSMLGGIGSALSSMRNIAGGILGAQLFLGIGRQIMDMGEKAIMATAQVQNMTMMLNSLQARELIKTGDFEDMNAALAAAEPLAKATMKELAKIAMISPYQLENVSNTYKMAMAFGYTSKESVILTKGLLDLAAGTGASGEMLDRMGYNLAQIRLQGKVTALDIRQLALAGLDLRDVLKYVGKQMGVNIETHEDFNKAIASGQITWEDFTTQFAKYSETYFGGSAERMSRTLYGLASTFKDVFALTMPAILGPALEEITGFLNEILTSVMSVMGSGKLEAMGESFKDFVSPIVDSLRSLAVEFGILQSAFASEREWEAPKKKFSLLDMFVDGTATFDEWTKAIDWDSVSANIVAGVQKIDWTTIGEKINVGFTNIFSGLGTLGSFDFTAVANSVTEGFADAVIAALGGSGNWAGVEAQWASNFEQLKIIASSKLLQTTVIMQALAGAAGTTTVGQFAIALFTGVSSVFNAIVSWIPEIERALQNIKSRFYTAFQQAVQVAVNALNSMQKTLLDAIQTLIRLALGVIKPIIIKVGVDLPNFAALIAKIEAGVAGMNDAAGGKQGKPKDPRNSGGGGGGGQEEVGSYAGGGISRGPTSGYLAMLHGTEAVVPLDNGGIPVNLSGVGVGGGGINITFVYSPVVSAASSREAQDVIAPMVAQVLRTELSKRNL